ncbi:hypothetical protein AAMO2058_000586700 [Amorphochlora amoebiformis]
MVTISFVLALSLCISQIVVPVNGGIPVRSRIPLARTPILFSTRAKCNRPFFGIKSEIEDNLRSSRRPLDNHVESYSSSTGRGQAAPQMRPKRDPLKNHPESKPARDMEMLFESKSEVSELLKRRQEIKELEKDLSQNVKDLRRHDYGIKLKEYMRHATDTGTPEFQIARATQRIYQIVQHMEVHRKDLATRRGLELLVHHRRRLLKYLRKTNMESYKVICEKLGIHDRVPPTPTYPAVGRRYGYKTGRQEKLLNSNRPIGMPF